MIAKVAGSDLFKVGNGKNSWSELEYSTESLLDSDKFVQRLQELVTTNVLITRNYELGEIYYFRHPDLKEGFQPAQGGVIEDCENKYPEIWSYLQTTSGQKLCTTEEAWQAMTQTEWGDGEFKASWDGIGGAPYFVQDLEAGTLRLPDLRGMVAVAAGDGNYGPVLGGVMGDMQRRLLGKASYNKKTGLIWERDGLGDANGVFTGETMPGVSYAHSSYSSPTGSYLVFDSRLATPTGATNIPRSWGALACVYLGQSST